MNFKKKTVSFWTHEFARRVLAYLTVPSCGVLADYVSERRGQRVYTCQVAYWMRKQYPDAVVIAEESNGEPRCRGGMTWFTLTTRNEVDPIDGLTYTHRRGIRADMANTLLAAPNKRVRIVLWDEEN